MFRSPDHYHNLSLRLSEVLSDIGVNERLVMRRRRACLLFETIANMYLRLFYTDAAIFIFGSQSEGSTTLGLRSDTDGLFRSNIIHVINDRSELKPGKGQCMMVQDATTSPGYCLLQAITSDIPAIQKIQHEHCNTDSSGRMLMRHNFCFQDLDAGSRNGPAQTFSSTGHSYKMDGDFVYAVQCSSWPKEAESWLQQHNVSGWPTADMKRYAVEHGCFVVPVASQANMNGDTEWRISTSFAERCLMFSLGMTPIRCYILMKMILKTFIKPKCGDTISSFMCKNVLFHCIADTRASDWNESNLLPCFNQCLQYLLHCILTENCPHFIIPGNNLLAGKLSPRTKEQLVEIMITLTTKPEESLLAISIDQLGNMLHVKSGRILPNHVPSSEDIAVVVLEGTMIVIAGILQKMTCRTLRDLSHTYLNTVYRNLAQKVSKLCNIYSTGSKLEKAACCLITPLLCASVGSIRASLDIHHSQRISPAGLQWFSEGLNSDFLSSRLKLASALYCAGNYEQCERILVHLSSQLEQTTVFSICYCYPESTNLSVEFERVCLEKNEVTIIKQNIAFCASFKPFEVNCVPNELRYEMFRSIEEDMSYRGDYMYDYWMDWAVIDSITFLYFLQYKVYSKLHRHAEQQQALHNLTRTINTEPNLPHRETAMNLLGKCMEEEHRKEEALRSYTMSLRVRRRNNAAKWHICILLAGLFNNRC